MKTQQNERPLSNMKCIQTVAKKLSATNSLALTWCSLEPLTFHPVTVSHKLAKLQKGQLLLDKTTKKKKTMPLMMVRRRGGDGEMLGSTNDEDVMKILGGKQTMGVGVERRVGKQTGKVGWDSQAMEMKLETHWLSVPENSKWCRGVKRVGEGDCFYSHII